MKNTRSLIYLVFLVTISGCTVVEYGIGNQGSRTSMAMKPTYRDSIITATYISSSFNTSSGYNEGESSKLGSISLNRAYTSKNFNASAGGFLFMGQYSNSDASGLPAGKKSFAGGGVHSGFNLNIPFKEVDWRIIGLDLHYLYEGGEYARFRELAAKNGTTTNNEESLNTLRISLTSELIIKANNSLDIGIGGSFGIGRINTTGYKIFVTKNRMSLYYEATINEEPIVNVIRFDIFKKSQTHSLGFVFRL